MSIIEKLGIEEISAYRGMYGCYVCDEINVRELEQQIKELLEALIEQSLSKDKQYGIRNWKMVELIGKVTGKSWEEIKQIADKENK